MPVDLSAGSIPSIYRELFDMIATYGIDKITLVVFVQLFESNILTNAILNQIWTAVIRTNSFSSRNDLYKCLALMALAQQGKTIDERLLDNYTNRELPSPTLESLIELENRLIRILRTDQGTTSLCFRYGDLCSLDTIQVDVAAEKKGVLIRHFEYEVTSLRHKSKVSRRYNDFVALHEILSLKYPFRIIPQLPPKKTVNVDKEFIEERRKSLKHFLEILCRHPIICETDIIKFFLTFQGTSCGDNMKTTFKNTLDEFNCESSISSNSIERIKHEEDSNGIRMFQISQTHITFLLQQFSQIRIYLKNINERNFQIAEEYSRIEKSLQLISTDSTQIQRWATGHNDYWPTIQNGLVDIPIEINAIAERMNEGCKCEDEIINEHLDMLIELLQGYKDLCKRFEEALQTEQRAIQKATNQNKRLSATNQTKRLSATDQTKRLSETNDSLPKNDNNLDIIEKRNIHALKCIQIETQLIYANLEAFVYILSGLGNIQYNVSSDLYNIWKSYSNKISRFGQTYTNKSSKQQTGGLKTN